MSFQPIIDFCESLSIDKKKLVASTTARNGMVRSVVRGNPPVKITAKMPDGMPWDLVKDYITAAEALDKYTDANIEIKFSLIPWYYGNVNPGVNEQYTVRCIEFPQWTIFARNQVSWSGPFVFLEVTE